MCKKSVIYYTDNRLKEPLNSLVQSSISTSDLPIVSVSLKPIEFGHNIVINSPPGYITMVYQILTALRNAPSKYVFFCEHDVLYNRTHFEFTPSKDNVFYYNSNVWRWLIGESRAIRYERMLPLSSLCCNTELALKNYELRWNKIHEYGLDQFKSREPKLARIWGYEPGLKSRRRGGLTNQSFDIWQSKEPIIDIRHKGTFSPIKIKLSEFKHLPKNWQEVSINKISSIKWLKTYL